MNFEVGQQFELKGVTPFRNRFNTENVTIDTIVEIAELQEDNKYKLKVIKGGWTIWNTEVFETSGTPPNTAEIAETFNTTITKREDARGVFYSLDEYCVPVSETEAIKNTWDGPWELKTRSRAQDGYLIPFSK